MRRSVKPDEREIMLAGVPGAVAVAVCLIGVPFVGTVVGGALHTVVVLVVVEADAPDAPLGGRGTVVTDIQAMVEAECGSHDSSEAAGKGFELARLRVCAQDVAVRGEDHPF